MEEKSAESEFYTSLLHAYEEALLNKIWQDFKFGDTINHAEFGIDYCSIFGSRKVQGSNRPLQPAALPAVLLREVIAYKKTFNAISSFIPTSSPLLLLTLTLSVMYP